MVPFIIACCARQSCVNGDWGFQWEMGNSDANRNNTLNLLTKVVTGNMVIALISQSAFQYQYQY